jgi:hypothetical protein
LKNSSLQVVWMNYDQLEEQFTVNTKVTQSCTFTLTYKALNSPQLFVGNSRNRGCIERLSQDVLTFESAGEQCCPVGVPSQNQGHHRKQRTAQPQKIHTSNGWVTIRLWHARSWWRARRQGLRGEVRDVRGGEVGDGLQVEVGAGHRALRDCRVPLPRLPEAGLRGGVTAGCAALCRETTPPFSCFVWDLMDSVN